MVTDGGGFFRLPYEPSLALFGLPIWASEYLVSCILIDGWSERSQSVSVLEYFLW